MFRSNDINTMRTKITLFISTALWAYTSLTDAEIIERRAHGTSSASCSSSVSAIPDYFDTISHGPYPGPTITGQAPFLAEIDPVAGLGGTRTFIVNTPLETAEPIVNNTDNINIFQYTGQVSS